MSDHYYEGSTTEEYDADYQEALDIVFGENGADENIYAYLPSLDGYVEIGKGEDELSAKEDYLEKISMFQQVLKEAELKIMYGLVDLKFAKVGEL